MVMLEGWISEWVGRHTPLSFGQSFQCSSRLFEILTVSDSAVREDMLMNVVRTFLL